MVRSGQTLPDVTHVSAWIDAEGHEDAVSDCIVLNTKLVYENLE